MMKKREERHCHHHGTNYKEYEGDGFGDVVDGLYDPAVKGGLFNLALRKQRDSNGNLTGRNFRRKNE